MSQLQEYPLIPVSLTNEIVAFCGEREDARNKLLLYGEDFPKDERTIELLLQWLPECPFNKIHLVRRFLDNTPTNILLKYEDQLTYYMSKNYMDIKKRYIGFEDKTDEDLEPLWKIYGELLANLDRDFDMATFLTAKYVQDILIRTGEYDETEVRYIIRDELVEEFFSPNGILAVRAVGIMQLHDLIPHMVQLLPRYEDILVEEVNKALIQLQSDEVVKAVTPLIADEDAFINAISILKNIKTPLAEKALIEAYPQTDDVTKQELLIEALVTHFSEHTFLLIDQFMAKGEYAGMCDMEEIFYAFYKAMNREHPQLEDWRQEVAERNAYFNEEIEKIDIKSLMRDRHGKIGRNDPCVCGSGKKYKKCCGK